MHEYHTRTMTGLHQLLCTEMLYGKRGEFDWVTNTDVVKEHVWAVADSMDWECDISRFWLPQSRWSMMQKQYLDPEEVTAWLKLAEKRAAGTKNANRVVLRTRKVSASFRGNATTRSLGSCMLSLSFSLQTSPTILLHSRTGYMGYLSPLDWSVAYHCARLIAHRIGLEPSDFRFIWFAESIQYHRFRTIAFALGDAAERKTFVDSVKLAKENGVLPEYIALDRNWEQYQKWLRANRDGVTFDGMTPYRSAQRPRKRFLTEVKGLDYARQFEDVGNKAFAPLRPIDVKDLRFDKIGLE